MNEVAEALGAVFPDSSGKIALAIVVIRGAGEVFSALMARGGVVGLVRHILFGEGIPKVISDDYRQELKNPPTKSNAKK